MNMCLMLALGRENWLGLELDCPTEKILFASHEMDSAELREFFTPMIDHLGLDDDEQKRLEENLYINARGRTTALDDPQNQKAYEDQLRIGAYTGLVIDTLGASTKDSLQDEKGSRTIADWIDKVRQRFGIWVVVLSHPRKAPSGVKNHIFGIDDAYGSRIFGDRANTILLMQRTKRGLELHSVKTRFMSGLDSLFLKRNPQHWYELGTPQVEQPKASVANVINEPGLNELIAKQAMEGEDYDFDS
jgi:RecA-family ATPase